MSPEKNDAKAQTFVRQRLPCAGDEDLRGVKKCEPSEQTFKSLTAWTIRDPSRSCASAQPPSPNELCHASSDIGFFLDAERASRRKPNGFSAA
jgi:hypothetical protein